MSKTVYTAHDDNVELHFQDNGEVQLYVHGLGHVHTIPANTPFANIQSIVTEYGYEASHYNVINYQGKIVRQNLNHYEAKQIARELSLKTFGTYKAELS